MDYDRYLDGLEERYFDDLESRYHDDLEDFYPGVDSTQAPGPAYDHGRGPSEPAWLRFDEAFRRDRPSPEFATRAAWFWLDMGFWPLLVAPAGKSPLMMGWGQRRPNPGLFPWAERKFPGYNVALMLGARGGLVDLDVDHPGAAEGVIDRMFHGCAPPTLGWRTAGGRYHLLFRWDDRLARYGKTVVKGVVHADGRVTGDVYYPGLELRFGAPPGSDKAFCTVIPPSRMADGTPRLWNHGRGIWSLPQSVFADLDRHLAPAAGGTCPCGGPAAPHAPPEGQKKGDTRPARGGRRRRGRSDPETRALMYLAKCDPAVEGENGSAACFKAACKVGPGFDLPPETTLRLLRDHYNPLCGPPWTEAELKHKVDDAYAREGRRGWLLEVPKGGTSA